MQLLFKRFLYYALVLALVFFAIYPSQVASTATVNNCNTQSQTIIVKDPKTRAVIFKSKGSYFYGQSKSRLMKNQLFLKN